MDITTTYGELLQAATHTVKALRAMLPNNVACESCDEYRNSFERDEAMRLDRIIDELETATVPF